VWTAMGITMQTPESVMQTSMMLLFPLTFASNVFVDPETMPGWLQGFVNNNPLTHLTTAARGLMHGDVDGVEVLWVFGWSAAFVAIFGPLTMKLYKAER
ncbi:MAG TPA: ABC transporter permease, partial [Acidimicrobiales bacterium]